jgi:hypothetical protein
MSLDEHNGGHGASAPDLMAVIQEHRQDVTFESATRLLVPGMNDATLEAVEGARRAASEHGFDAGAVLLIEYVERLSAIAPSRDDVAYELETLVTVLRSGSR